MGIMLRKDKASTLQRIYNRNHIKLSLKARDGPKDSKGGKGNLTEVEQQETSCVL